MLLNEESRLSLVTRWLEWLGLSHEIYNVVNTHQCFNEKPRTIIRPFKEESNFYGCIKCGKYHFCYHSHHTCDSIAPTLDINNNMPTCAYSGQTIRNVHNEALGNHDQITIFKSDSNNGVMLIYSDNAINSSGLYGSAAIETRRINAMENVVHQNSIRKGGKNGSPTKKERRTTDKQDMNQYFFNRGVAPYLQQSETLSLSKRKKKDEENEKELPGESLTCTEEYGVVDYDDDDDEEGDDEPSSSSSSEENMVVDTSTVGGVMRQNQILDDRVDDELMMLYDPLVHGEMMMGGDDDIADHSSEEDVAAYDDRLMRIKNPHNNVAFWDQYYSFLIDGGPLPIFTPQTDEDSTVTVNNTQTNNSEYEEDQKKDRETYNGYLYDTSRPRHLFKVDPSRWNTDLSILVEEEVRRIIDIIMRTYMIRKQVNNDNDDDPAILSETEYPGLLKRLTRYYHNIVCNIIILIYHSPHIEKLALQRYEKHEKQGKSSYSAKITVTVTDISSLLDEETGPSPSSSSVSNPIQFQNACDLICPKKVCASLMLHLFTEMFFLCDSMTNHICVWVKDPWLTHMKHEVFDEIIMDYNIIVDPLNHPMKGGHDPMNKNKKRQAVQTKAQQYENIFFKKDLTAMSTTIRTSLSTYNCHPMWLSSMIYNFKRQ